jgi:hypothetical protein
VLGRGMGGSICLCFTQNKKQWDIDRNRNIDFQKQDRNQNVNLISGDFLHVGTQVQ